MLLRSKGHAHSNFKDTSAAVAMGLPAKNDHDSEDQVRLSKKRRLAFFGQSFDIKKQGLMRNSQDDGHPDCCNEYFEYFLRGNR